MRFNFTNTNRRFAAFFHGPMRSRRLIRFLLFFSAFLAAWFPAAAIEIQIGRKDVDNLLNKNLEIRGSKLEYEITCNIERMGRQVTFNGGCRYFDIFKNFINKNSNGKIDIELDFELRQGSLSILFAPDDFVLLPQYASTTPILKSCDLVRLENKEKGARFIRVGPNNRNAIRCLTLGLLKDLGISIAQPESDPMSKDYMAYYLLLVSPYSDFVQAVEYVRETLKKDDLSITIKE